MLSKTIKLFLSIVIVAVIASAFGAGLSKTVLYQAPDECKWSGLNEHDIILVCNLRTINSELENTNFSVIQPQNTIRLKLECNDALFFQSSLTPGSFKNLIELQSLTIEYCKLGNLTNGSFKGLHALKNLTVRTHNSDWSSMSLEISENVFNDFRQLELLDLTKNNIHSIPDGMICPLKTLSKLNISHNQIQDLNHFHFSASLKRKSKICGSFLTVLDLSFNKISNLASAILSNLSRLKILNLQQNEINFIADSAFEGLLSLETINLSENKLKNLAPPELFFETKYIKEIYLRNNSMNVLAPGIFNGLSELLVLDLSSNKLNSQWINSGTFIGLKRLIILDISNNQINKLETTIFKNLQSLQVLKLQENVIDSIPDYLFSELANLHTLILSNNHVTEINDKTLNGLCGLLVLSLDYNKITSIHLNSFSNCSILQDLHLNSNKLRKIPEALKFVPVLKTLDLGENLINNVENTSLVELENLYGLRLTENLIHTIKNGIFDKMSSLKIINLSKNKINLIENDAFKENKQLQAIRLDGNYLKSINNLFIKLPNLVWLNISDNNFETFDYSNTPTGLQWLDLHANKITQLGNYFDIDSELSLSTFDASFNDLTEITTTSIPNSVSILYLNDNLITKIHPYTFFKKKNLTRVDLSRNRIITMEPNALRLSPIADNKQIPEFYISGNPVQCDCNLDWIKKINLDTRTQPKLMDLDNIYCNLSYNREATYLPLIKIKAHEFLCKYETHCFPLCHCCDYFACDCKMECPSRCKCYHDQSWTSNIVDCSRANYKETLPKHLPMDSTQLYLDGNHFNELSSHTFLGKKRLKILYLNNSFVELILNRTFYGLHELEILQLDHNNLKSLDGNEFHGLDSLKELFLNHNKLTYINNYTFTHLYNLKILHIQNNEINEFNGWNFFPAYLSHLRISSNPWTCNCKLLMDIQNFIKQYSIIKDLSKSTCRIFLSNSTYEQKKIEFVENLFYADSKNGSDIKSSYFPCTKNKYMNETSEKVKKQKILLPQRNMRSYVSCLVSIFSAIIVFISTILILFIFRQEIRIWFHSRFGIRLLFNANRDFDKKECDKLFDAFISYSSKDSEFVNEEFLPILENGDPHYKLCLYYRDITTGSYVSDSITQAIDSSRRTIMIISNNFLKSEWSEFDFKYAHHHALRDRRRRLIVILLGDLPSTNLDPDIHLYLKTHNYLKWSDKLFWEKLRFALPDVPNNHQRSYNLSTTNPQISNNLILLQNTNNRQNINPSCNNGIVSQELQSSISLSTPRTISMHI